MHIDFSRETVTAEDGLSHICAPAVLYMQGQGVRFCRAMLFLCVMHVRTWCHSSQMELDTAYPAHSASGGFGVCSDAKVLGETWPHPLIQHPEDEPISIYLQIQYKLDGDPTFAVEEAAELPLVVKGTVAGSRYALHWAVYDFLHDLPLHEDKLHFDTVNVLGRATNVFAGTAATEVTSFQIPAGSVNLEGVTQLLIVVRDRYPGLSEDDAFLALTRRRVAWWHSRCEQNAECRLREDEALLARRRHLITVGASATKALIAQREALRLLRSDASLTQSYSICTTYSIRPLRANEGQALCQFYTDGLSAESRTNFHYLMSNGHRDAADTQKCHEIAAAGALSQSVCAEDEGLEACNDDAAQEGGVRFDLVLLPQGDRAAILGWAFFTVGEGGNVYEGTVGIAIADALQGKGFGKKMMHALIAAAHTAPMVTALQLNVLASNVRAVALYEQLGFERLSTWHYDHHPFLSANDTLVRMRLLLEPRR